MKAMQLGKGQDTKAAPVELTVKELAADSALVIVAVSLSMPEQLSLH